MASRFTLPIPTAIKPLEIDSTSVFLQWAVPSRKGLTDEQLAKLVFEFRTTDDKLRADCIDSSPATAYKARLMGLKEDSRYRFQIRSKLIVSANTTLVSKWSDRIEINTPEKCDAFTILSAPDGLEQESLKHKLQQLLLENRKLKLQLEQLQSTSSNEPGHWSWNHTKIVNWMLRIKSGKFAAFEATLSEHMGAEGITGKDLRMIAETDLLRWGVTDFSGRKVLMHYITALTENDPAPDIEYDPMLTNNLSPLADAAFEEEPREEAVVEPERVPEPEPDEEPDEAPQEAAAAEPEAEEEEVVTEPEDDEKSGAIARSNELLSPSEGDHPNWGLSSSVQKLIRAPNEPKEWKYKEGMLSVTVVRATNVDAMDKDDGSASDPYVELTLKGNYRPEKTKFIQDDANPVWNEKFQLFVDDAKNDVLKLKLYDHDKWLRDDKIGEVQIPIITVLAANGMVDKEYDVVGSKQGAKVQLVLKYWEGSF